MCSDDCLQIKTWPKVILTFPKALLSQLWIITWCSIYIHRSVYSRLDSLQIWNSHVGRNSSSSCQHWLTNSVAIYLKCPHALWIMGMRHHRKVNVWIYCASRRHTMHVSEGGLITAVLPGETIAGGYPECLFFYCVYRCCFSSRSGSGSLAPSAAAPPVNYHISNFPPAQIRPLLPAWPSCLLWGGLSSSSLTVNR